MRADLVEPGGAICALGAEAATPVTVHRVGQGQEGEGGSLAVVVGVVVGTENS